MQHFTENASVSPPRAVDDWVGAGSDSQTLDIDETVLPGVLEVYLIRATDLELVGIIAGWQTWLPFPLRLHGLIDF